MSSSVTAQELRRGRISFADITAPLEPAQFLSDHWAQKAVLLRATERDFDSFCGWDAVNAILNAGDCTFPQIKVSRSDDAVSPDLFTTNVGGQRIVNERAVVNLFREGASFGITGADSHWPPLRSIVDCFHDALLESVHANIYCSPPNTQGFQCHYDLHEVFVLQVEGTKHWRVFRPFVDAPIESWRREEGQEALQTDAYVDVVLQKGDVLYVPRGHWHYAVAQDSVSLHVTVGITCRKGMAFLDWLGGELSQETTWRRNAPVLSAPGGGDPIPAGFAQWAGGLKRSLLEKLSDPTLFDRFLKDTASGIQPIHTIDMPLQGLAEQLPVDRLVFERPSGRHHVFEQKGPSEVIVSVAGSDIQLEGVSPIVISRMFASPSFTLADIKTWDPTVSFAETSELLTELVRSGLLMTRPISG
jgi:ribosomal protein L16 Arg81 hydroxylase